MTTEATEKSAQDRRQDKKAEKRLAILDGAVRVFAEKGFFNATVAEIARSAGVADGTIYLYFKSKDELLLSVFDEKMQALCDAARAVTKDATSTAAALRQVVALHLSAVQASPAVARVLIVELRQSSAFVRDQDKPRLTEYLNLIGDLVKRGQASGELRQDVHPSAVKRALFGALDEMSLGWLVARRQFDLAESGRGIADVFVRGLLASPADSK